MGRACLHYVVDKMTRHPCLFVCLVLLCFALGCAWLSCRGETVSAFPKHRPLFTSKAKVHEIFNGSLEELSSFLDQSPLKFVLFYAPWCGQSRSIVPQFVRAANILHREVTFIAINCWTGSCKEKYILDSFPKLLAYHTDFPGVQYPEDYDLHSSYMVKFIQDIVRPFSYITRETDLQELKNKNQEVVLSYHNDLESKDYLRFFGTALSFTGQVSRPLFGLITDINLARKEGMVKNGDMSFYRLLHPTLLYNPTVNTTVQNISDWISKSRKELIVELVPRPTNRHVLESQLTDKPAVILFLPLRRQAISSPLLTMYTQMATNYHNCSCINTSTPETHSLDTQLTEEEELPFPTVNLNDIRPSRTLTVQEKLAKDDFLCGSLILKDKTYNRRNVCDICCTKGRHYHHGDVLDVIINRLRRTGLSLPSSCGSMQTFYYPVLKASICCGRASQSAKHIKMAELRQKFRFTDDPVLRQNIENLFDTLYDKLLKAIEPLQKGNIDDINVYSGLEATKDRVPGQSSVQPPPAAVSTKSINKQRVQSNTSPKDINQTDGSRDGCNRTGHVAVFNGASCHSNRSVNFFYMDTGRFWSVAQRLGVKGSSDVLKSKVALAVVDVKNEVYHVLNEDLPINNNTIVEFVMHFMNTRLKQALRSADKPSNACPEPHACVLEVTSATLDDIVMDDDKDVLLMYYASWCGFCINLAPVLLTVARFFKDNKHVTIARIDGDQNDLPWQHTVAAYPTIILFPAKRKDFSLRFPDESERTAESLIQFILNHGTEAALFETTNGRCDSDVIKARLDHLESSLLRVEREKQLLETRIEGLTMEKSLLGYKNLKLLKGIKVAQESAKKERDSRISMQSMYEQAEESRSELNEKYLSLLLKNAKLEIEVKDLKGERHILDEKVQEKKKEIQRLVLEKDELEDMKQLVAKKLDKAEETAKYLRNRDRLLTRKVRLLQRFFKDLYWKHRLNSNRNAKTRQLLHELHEEKRLTSDLLVKLELSVADLKAALSAAEMKLEEEERKRTSVMKQNSEANQQLKEMKMNYEKLTVILSQIDIPKEQKVS